jgi:hypothetical protein
MSQELEEDVKPKLNLNIAYDGSREGFFFAFSLSLLLGYYSLTEIVMT